MTKRGPDRRIDRLRDGRMIRLVRIPHTEKNCSFFNILLEYRHQNQKRI
jgi:hypothetical protein